MYPHQLKDKKAIARLEIAIRTFDAAAGKRRRDMDAQAMTDFFGDPRLARGIVACLGQFYKYETPDFRQMVGRDAAGRLRDAELTKPSEVRAFTYAYVNERHDGFLAEGERAACYEALAGEFLPHGTSVGYAAAFGCRRQSNSDPSRRGADTCRHCRAV